MRLAKPYCKLPVRSENLVHFGRKLQIFSVQSPTKYVQITYIHSELSLKSSSSNVAAAPMFRDLLGHI